MFVNFEIYNSVRGGRCEYCYSATHTRTNKHTHTHIHATPL